MDPLSISAGVLAVLQAVSSTSKFLQKLASLRRVPEQVLQLCNEVEDFHGLVTRTRIIFSSISEDDDQETGRQIERLCIRALAPIRELEDLLQDKIIRNYQSGFADEADIHIFRRAWLRKSGEVQRLLISIREIRLAIDSGLICFSARISASIPRFKNDLSEIRFIYDETSSYLRDIGSRSERHLDEITRSIQTIKSQNQDGQGSLETSVATLDTQHRDQTELITSSFQKLQLQTDQQLNLMQAMETTVKSSLETLQSSLQQLEQPPHYPSKRISQSSQSPGESSLFQSATKVRINTSIYQPTICSAVCSCQCHKVARFELSPWLARFTGSLFVGYSGIPLTTRPACDKKKCKREQGGIVKITYHFPSYLPWVTRILFIMDQWNSLDGHRFMLHAPRVVSSSSEIFILAQRGNIEGIQALFAQKKASIYDVSAGEGRSAVHYALTGGRPDVVAFLLSQRSNVYIEDKLALSPIDILWNYILKDNEDPVTQGLRAPFECFLDESEDLQKRSFSPLHLIVFGLSKVDLTSYLELDTECIDSCCSLGRTPLAWAAYRRDPEPVKYLIKFGAAIDIPDWRGQSAFSLAAETGHFKSIRILLRTAVRLEDRTSRLDPELVEHLFNDENDQDNTAIANVGTFCRDMIEARDYKGRSALQFATRTNQLAHASILLRYGADVDSPDAFYRTPLHIAIYWNHHDVMRLLLENGASHHSVDENRLTLLHYAAKFADLTTLEILREARIRGISPECRDSEGYTPSEIFDRLRPGILAEDSDTYAKSREEFEAILEMSSVSEVEESDTASIDQWFDTVSSLEGSLESLLPLVDELEQV